MDNSVQFTRNHNDLSTNQGFQFEFVCDRCGNGYRSRFKPYTMGALSDVADTASSLIGGFFGRAADLSNRVSTAGYQKAKEQAFIEAGNELKPQFIQCPNCLQWVCRKGCWNKARGLCKSCAPDITVVKSAAQASKTNERIMEKAEVSEEDAREVDSGWKETIAATCPSCGAALAKNAKFCPECGAKLKVETKCPKCGVKTQPGAKFCGECGTKLG